MKISPFVLDTRDAYSRAAHHLQLSIVPEDMPCREEERLQVEKFINHAITTDENIGNVFYI